MLIEVAPKIRRYVDIEGCGLVRDGPGMRAKPTRVLLHGGPGVDHSSFKPLIAQLADLAQIVYFNHRGHGRSGRCPGSAMPVLRAFIAAGPVDVSSRP